MNNGVLLINLGTPDSPKTADVRKYLAEFLMDPRVIDIPWLARAALVYGLILPARPAKSGQAYRKIWTDRGSPLLFHSQDLVTQVQTRLPNLSVELGMRYGSPSIHEALTRLKEKRVERLFILPLYPQYSYAATLSSEDEVKRSLDRLKWSPELRWKKTFYDDPGFIAAFTVRIRESLNQGPWDYVLFSYHGIPERHLTKLNNNCLASNACCEKIPTTCYRAQCFATTRAIAAELHLSPEQHSVSFQSRLGRTPWLKPYTDFELKRLAEQGVKHLVVTCPAFVADCLETLEEIEIRGAEDFKRFGGRTLRLVPSLNSSELWANAVAEFCRPAFYSNVLSEPGESLRG